MTVHWKNYNLWDNTCTYIEPNEFYAIRLCADFDDAQVNSIITALEIREDERIDYYALKSGNEYVVGTRWGTGLENYLHFTINKPKQINTLKRILELKE